MAVRTVALLHAQTDSTLCDTIAAQLTVLGLNVWHDRDQPDVALALPLEIEAEISRARAYVVVLTPATASSRLAQLEINAAFRQWQADPSRVIVQILVRPSQPPALLQGFPLIDGARAPVAESAAQVVGYIQAAQGALAEAPATTVARPPATGSGAEKPATTRGGGAITRRALIGAGVTLPVLGGLGYLAYSRHILFPPRKSAVSGIPGASSAPRDHSPVHYSGMSQYFATSLAWSPDGHAVAVANAGVHVFNSYDATPIYQYYHNFGDEVYAVEWSPDGKRIACALSYDHDEIHIWDAFTGANEVVCRGPRQDMYALAWSPDGKQIAVASNDGNVYVFGSATGRFTSVRNLAVPVVTVAWSPDGARLCANGANGSVHIWSPSTGEEFGVLAVPDGSVRYLAWYPDSQRLVAALDTSIVYQCNLSTGRTVAGFAHPAEAGGFFSLSANGRLFASATRYQNEDDIFLYDASTMQDLPRPIGYAVGFDGISALACSPDGQRVAVCESTPSGDSQITVFWLS